MLPKMPALIYAWIKPSDQVDAEMRELIKEARAFADEKVYKVNAVFSDIATEETTKKPGWSALLQRLREQPGMTVFLANPEQVETRLGYTVKLRDQARKAGAVFVYPDHRENPIDLAWTRFAQMLDEYAVWRREHEKELAKRSTTDPESTDPTPDDPQ